MSSFTFPEFDHHEQVHFKHDEKSGLNAIIAVHNTTLGPALGGCRIYPYASFTDALCDALRLSRGMTYKSALAGLPLGGGKAVIIANPKKDKSTALLHAMGEFVDSLGGLYITAEDSGTCVKDIKTIGEKTQYVSGILESARFGGDPSPSTAYGVFAGIKAAVKFKLGLNTLDGIRVAIQGIGNVGHYLARYLIDEHATVLVADMDAEKINRLASELIVSPVSVENIAGMDVDVFAPCALGAVINDQTVKSLHASIVAGAANNQLAEPRHARELLERGILYAPDFVINAGGIINVHYQRTGQGVKEMQRHIETVAATLTEIFTRSAKESKTTNEIAEELARERLWRADCADTPRKIA